MDNNNDEIKLHMYQAAKIAIKREGSDGAVVAAWNIADENGGCSAMIAGNGHNCVVAIANIIDKFAVGNNVPYQDILRELRSMLRTVARNRRRMKPGEEPFKYTRVEIDNDDDTDDATE